MRGRGGGGIAAAFATDAGAVRARIARNRLEGVVFERLDSRYEAGRRSGAWLKLKHRRTETFALTGWSPARPHVHGLDSFYVARLDAGGRPRPAGSVQLGLSSEARRELRAAAEASSAPSRRAIRDVAPGITLEVSFHGTGAGPLRDPVLRAFSVGG
jgi:bifunctional non-homologous end joining protein LigD